MTLVSGPATGGTLDDLSPTEGLVLDVVTSRYVLGHPFWSVDRANRKALDRLVERGLVTYESGSVQGVYDVTATKRALALCLSTLTAPALDPRCRSAYFGPMSAGHRIDCTRRSQHRGKHKAVFAPSRPPVKWTDAQAWGADHEFYAESLARAEALWAEKDPCGESLDYEPYGITVACDMPTGHDTRHLWPGDPHRRWIKPIAWATPFKRPFDWDRRL